jgi:putative Mg2+ transporter-C (MgtC) family protein
MQFPRDESSHPIQLLVERGSVSLDTAHQALGTGSVRVKQFIVQQSEDDADLDDVQIALSRVNAGEFSTICTRLEAMSGVRECRRDK